MESEEVRKISGELEELLNMQEERAARRFSGEERGRAPEFGGTSPAPGAEELKKAQEEYVRLSVQEEYDASRLAGELEGFSDSALKSDRREKRAPIREAAGAFEAAEAYGEDGPLIARLRRGDTTFGTEAAYEKDGLCGEAYDGDGFPGELLDYDEAEEAWEEEPYLEEEAERGFFRRGHAFLRPGDGLIAAFVVPVLIMLIIFIQRGIFPFGEESFLRTDMYHQYAPFFSEFQYKLTHGGSLLYSWDVGMGVNFSALYAYYLASPFNWLLIFCPKGWIIEFMTYSIVLKIGLAGLAMAWYLRRRWGTRDFGVAFFGIFYALSGYMAAYSWNIMWLDCIILFPVIMLGLERLVREKKPLLYCVSLGMSILSNYYISIMICIFMVLYFIALLILEGRRSLRDTGRAVRQFTVYSLAAGGLAAVVLLPEIFALQATASGDFNFPKTVESYFSIFDMLARHIGNVETEIGLDHWPNIYCGMAVLMFFLLYLACRKIPVREKAVYCGLLLLFFASFSVNVLNFIWHGFHYPNSLPCRQSFIYIFLLLTACYRAYMYLRQTPVKHVAMAFWGSAAFVLLAEKLVTEDHFHFSVFYVALIFLAAYGGLAWMYVKRRASRNVLVFLALGLVSVEAAVNTTVTSVTTTSRTSYVRDNEEVRDLMEGLTPNDSFFRVEKVDRKTKNDGAWMNFPSVSLFSSTANADLTAFVKKLGCESSTNAYSITGSTPLVDALFSVRYGLYTGKPLYEDGMVYLAESGNTYLYENLYTLPLGFLMDPRVEENWQLDQANPADVQNDLCDLLGAEPVLQEVYGEVLGSQMTVTPDEAGDYYVYVVNRKVKEVTVNLPEETLTFDNTDRGYFLELGHLEAGLEITMSCDSSQIMDARVYRFSEPGMSQVHDTLNRMPWRLTKWTDTELEGTVTAGYDGVLYTSIPYDKGWSITVDGAPVEGRKIFDTFLAVDLTEGHHTVTMTYEPQGLREGAVITLACVLFVAGMAAWGHVQNKRRRR